MVLPVLPRSFAAIWKKNSTVAQNSLFWTKSQNVTKKLSTWKFSEVLKIGNTCFKNFPSKNFYIPTEFTSEHVGSFLTMANQHQLWVSLEGIKAKQQKQEMNPKMRVHIELTYHGLNGPAVQKRDIVGDWLSIGGSQQKLHFVSNF